MRGLIASASFPIMRAKHVRNGVRIRGARGHPEVRRAFIRFARWLRKEYDFPIRVPVYLFPSEQIITMHGDRVSASFFAPYDRSVEPFIRVATGDYVQLNSILKQSGLKK